MENEVFFTFDYDYDRSALRSFVEKLNEADKWDSYIPPSWDPKKYTIDNFTGVTYRYYQDLENLQPVKSIRESLNFPDLDYKSTQFLKFPPFNGPTIHRDLERKTAVIFPINESEPYEPLRFYRGDDVEFWFQVDYKEKVIVFDAQVLHAVENKEYDRYSLQFDIQEPFHEVREKYKRGEFFRA